MEVSLYEINPIVKQLVDEKGAQRIREAVSIKGKLERYGKIDELIAEIWKCFYETEADELLYLYKKHF